MRGFSLIELTIVLAIAGILAAMGTSRSQKLGCRANKVEAYAAMNAVSVLEESHRAETGSYKTFAASCPVNSTTCFVYASNGKGSKFNIAAEVTMSGYLITAAGKATTSMSGAIWRMDQSRTITDVTRTCN